jgi:LPXTG-site transpeptidase (sortase) family protein
MQKIRKFLLIIVGLGALLYGVHELVLRFVPRAVTLPPIVLPRAEVQVEETALPTRLVIPTLALDLPVIPAHAARGVWSTTTHGVSYLTTSPLPGESGNMVIYGHNYARLLGNLGKVKPGQAIQVFRGDVAYTYIVHFVGVVDPTDTYIVENTSDARLTLYTCTGFLDTKRLVVTALLDRS